MRSAYEERYRVFYHDQENKFVCFYCGEPASTLDHQPPLSRVDDFVSLQPDKARYVKVPCCEECNSLLSTKLTADLFEREMLVKEMLEKRYRRLLNYAPWTDKEIRNCFHGRLLQRMKGHKARLAWIERRLDYGAGVNSILEASS